MISENIMKWYDPLYFSDNLTLKMRKNIVFNITNNICQDDIFLLILCENGSDNFRIVPAVELLQKHYPKRELFVIGIAKGKDEAFELVENIVREIYITDGHLHNIKGHFQSGRA